MAHLRIRFCAKICGHSRNLTFRLFYSRRHVWTGIGDDAVPSYQLTPVATKETNKFVQFVKFKTRYYLVNHAKVC